MKKQLLKIAIILITILSVNIIGLYAQEKNSVSEANLTDEQIAGFKQQAIATVKELGDNIKTIIANRKKARATSNKFIGMSVKLFVSENSTVQVSSKSGRVDTIRIRTYLNRLKALSYQSIEITFYDIYLSKNFIKGDDGRYYGTATIFQKFEGRNNNEQGSYTDITKKSIQLVIEKAKYGDGLADKERWILKLGDINVEETK